jgi:hypothetical protein
MDLTLTVRVELDEIVAAQHTWTRGCGGLHKPGPCPPSTQMQVIYPGTAGITRVLPQ